MKVKEIDNGVYRIWEKTFLFKYINPVNQEEEKKKFFLEKNYNPKFKYIKLDFDCGELKKELLEYKKELSESKIENLISKKIDKLILWLIMLENRGSKKFTKYSLKYYGKPSKGLVEKSFKIIKIKTEKEKKEISSKKVVDYLSKKIKEMKLDWKVKEEANLGARADNVDPEKTLYIKKGELFSKNDLKRLVVHELKTHIVRAVNGLKRKYKIFYIGTAEYEPVEEGLAIVMEERNNVLSDYTLKNYSGRVAAVDLALRKSFRKVYNFLRKYFNEEDAYQICLRVKRGLADTSMEGGFTKDYIYLDGREKLKNIKNLKPLFYGRIGLDY